MEKKHHFRQAAALAAAVALLTCEVSAAQAETPAAPVSTSQTQMVVPCGMPFGIKLFTNGVIVVGTADLETSTGSVNPAREADVRVGDAILTVNGKAVTNNEDLACVVRACGGRSLALQLRRQGRAMSAKLCPVQSAGCYRAGLWVRDSAAGVGTLTFYDPQNHMFAGLGHGITDPDTKEVMPLGSGDIVPVTISGIQKGEAGTPGELQGYFSSDISEGTLYQNSALGVYGSMKQAPHGRAVAVCPADEVQTGPVQILCTLDDRGARLYTAEIELLNTHAKQNRNLILHITDSALLQKTSGIVQGMSGSPILQNGRLVGAVTHVFVKDPTRGYGILAEHMLQGERLAEQNRAA